MGLPHYDLPRETVHLPDGQTIEVRGLSRGEVLKMGALDDATESEVMGIAWATGLPVDEVRAWHSMAPFGVVQPMVDAIARLSGTDQESGKGSAEA